MKVYGIAHIRGSQIYGHVKEVPADADRICNIQHFIVQHDVVKYNIGIGLLCQYRIGLKKHDPVH
ncbi:hypothetical protein D3C86_1669190 [compost metagenome]